MENYKYVVCALGYDDGCGRRDLKARAGAVPQDL